MKVHFDYHKGERHYENKSEFIYYRDKSLKLC